MRRRALALGQAARGAQVHLRGAALVDDEQTPALPGLGLRRLPLALSQAAVPPHPSFAAKGLLPGARKAVQC